MRILFLDDDETRHKTMTRLAIGHTLTQCRTVPEVAEALTGAPYDLVALDHDLGGNTYVPSEGPEPTGYQAAQLLVDLPPDRRPKRVVIHSFNSVGAKRMGTLLREAGILATESPFGRWTLPKVE